MAHPWPHPPDPYGNVPGAAAFQYQYMHPPGQQLGAAGQVPVPSPSARQPYPPVPVNFQRFGANSQIPPGPFDGAAPRFSTAGFDPALFQHFSTSNLPPPPPPTFPPLPLPTHSAFPAFLPQSSTPNSLSYPHPPPPAFPNRGGFETHQFRPQPAAHVNIENTGSIHDIANKEDGELSDGELEETRMLSNSARSSNQVSLAAQDSVNMGNALRREIVDTPAPAPALSEGEDSMSSYNPPSASTPDLGGRSPLEDDQEPTSVAGPSGGGASLSNLNGVSISSYKGRGAFEMRELAKGALVSLAPHKIAYSELLEEGVNPQLLAELYGELELAPIMVRNPDINVSRDDTDAGTRKNEAISSTVTPQTAVKPPSQPPALPAPKPMKQPPSVLPPSIQAPPEPRLDLSGPPSKVGSTGPSASMEPVKSSTIPPAPGTSMERKDRIAQLLAAKTGRIAPRRDSSNAGSPSLAAKPSPTPSATASEVQAQIPAPVKSKEQEILTAPTNAHYPTQTTVKSKNKAQTELVRQKMEQLRREALVKVQASNASITATQIVASATATSEPPIGSAQSNGQMSVGRSFRSTNEMSTIEAAVMASSFSSTIPGLFMTESEPTPSPVNITLDERSAENSQNPDHISAEPEELQRSVRSQNRPRLDLSTLSREPSRTGAQQKRPRASDAFDESSMPPSKQRIGSRPGSDLNELSVSEKCGEDNSEGEIMEIDESSPISPMPKPPPLSSTSFLGSVESPLPVVPAAGPEQLQLMDATVGSTSPAASLKSDAMEIAAVTNSKQTGTQSWQEKQLEIEAMRKRIEEMENRRRTKQNQSQITSPGASISGKPQVLKSSSPAPVTNAVQFNPAKHSGKLSDDVRPWDMDPSQQPPVQAPLGKSSPSLAEKSAILKAEALRQQLLRRKMLKDGLPEFDAEVQRTQSRQAEAKARLAKLRLEAERREQEAREARKREQEIMEEVKALEQQLAMGISEQKQYSAQMEPIGRDKSTNRMTDSLEPSGSDDSGQADGANEVMKPSSDPSLQDGYEKSPEIPMDTGQLMEENADTHKNMEYAAEEAHIQSPKFDRALNDEVSHGRADQPFSVVREINMHEVTDRLPRPEPLERLPLEDHQRSKNLPSTTRLNASPGTPSECTSQVEPSVNIDDDSESDGSASMSDSGSEDYEPADLLVTNGLPEAEDDEDLDEYDPIDASIANASLPMMEEDQDDYEPAEVIEDVLLLSRSQAASALAEEPVVSVSEGSNLEEDQERGLELTEAHTLTKTQKIPLSMGDSLPFDDAPPVSDPAKSHFTPYQSVLKDFKSFRFHPQFTELVPDGHRSLTYSYNIDPKRPLCPTEAIGDLCNDPTCEEQHFRQMSMADEKILVQMSSAYDIPDKAGRNRFVEGLKTVIADLRTKKISDFDKVAFELAAYRRRFREEQDPALAVTATPS